MEKRSAIILRHKQTGLYYDKMNGHGKELWQARRFMNEEQLAVWLEVSIYRPADPDEYEPVEVELKIQEVMQNVQKIGEHKSVSGGAGKSSKRNKECVERRE